MSLGQAITAIDGWNRVHGPKDKPDGMSDDKLDLMLAHEEPSG